MITRLVDTPSGGEHEVLAALLNAHAHDDRYVTVDRLRRHFGPRVTEDDILAALALASDDDFLNEGEGTFQLSDLGLIAARQHKNPRFLTVV